MGEVRSDTAVEGVEVLGAGEAVDDGRLVGGRLSGAATAPAADQGTTAPLTAAAGRSVVGVVGGVDGSLGVGDAAVEPAGGLAGLVEGAGRLHGGGGVAGMSGAEIDADQVVVELVAQRDHDLFDGLVQPAGEVGQLAEGPVGVGGARQPGRLMAALTRVLIFVPYIPGLRVLPRHLGVHRLIWRNTAARRAAK